MDFSWFWDERFWFPSNRSWGWKDLELKEGSDVYLPQINDLYAVIPFAVALVIVRFMYERLLVVPIALRLGISKRQRTVPKPNPVLESAFKQHHSNCPDHKTILALSKQTDLPERAVQIWFRRRKLKDASTPLTKFRESSWQLLFYSIFFIYGMVVVWNKPYTWKTRLCWEGWPVQHVSMDLYWYYITELAFYWSQVFTLFYDHRRKDFIEMMVHHVATIGLLSFSWVSNWVRAGSLVLLVHDAADSWLSLAKMSLYLKNESVTDIFFGIFLIVWILTRLIIYPYVILYCTTVEPFNIIDAAFGGYITMNVLLYTLQILHILWSIMIFRVVIGKFTQGSLCLHFAKEEIAGYFTYTCVLLSCDCLCSAFLPLCALDSNQKISAQLENQASDVRDVRSDNEESGDESDNSIEANATISHGDKTNGLNPANYINNYTK